ncbi:MAG TPA: hypothetical protein PLL66_08775, partial [Bacteroidales bacterium]|nr:hypothetical protein [Bacteroidales bacterium]
SQTYVLASLKSFYRTTVKENDEYLLYMVSSEEYWENEEFLALIKEFALGLSGSVFENQNVEIVLCDEYFNPKRYVSMN